MEKSVYERIVAGVAHCQPIRAKPNDVDVSKTEKTDIVHTRHASAKIVRLFGYKMSINDKEHIFP